MDQDEGTACAVAKQAEAELQAAEEFPWAARQLAQQRGVVQAPYMQALGEMAGGVAPPLCSPCPSISSMH